MIRVMADGDTLDIGAHDALLVVDVQNDFCAGGTLEVPDGEKIVAPINAIMSLFPLVVLTQDWHPAGHIPLPPPTRARSRSTRFKHPMGSKSCGRTTASKEQAAPRFIPIWT